MLTSVPKLALPGNAVYLTAATLLEGFSAFEQQTIARYGIRRTDGGLARLRAVRPIPAAVKAQVAGFCDKEEGFVITCDGEEAVIYADTPAGTGNGVMVFLRSLDDEGGFGHRLMWDYPLCSLRGIKLMTPGREEIPDFKAFVDLMAYYRHNTVMLELGGAMEYKRHPEINEGWVEYAAFMSEYSGKSHKLQDGTFPWRKDSIHSDNGGGGFLTQEELKELIAYCEERHIQIIPEVPSTSHCDYMLTRHPELAERVEDPYPDTFCPSNPASYALLFDILDEVIEVFHPTIINIGHDEYYSINVCDRCRKRLMDAADILAEDITKIHDYLAAKGVKTMFWCDKLLDVRTNDGANFGGAVNYVYMGWDVKGQFLGTIPATWQAREKIPADTVCLHWFWSFDEKYDEDIRRFPVVFGNFSGIQMPHFRRRCGENTFGGICSNWGGTRDVYLRHNAIYFGLAYNDALYWDGTFDDEDDEAFVAMVDRCFASLYEEHYGAAPAVEVVHTTDKDVWHRMFADGVFPYGEDYDRAYTVGEYVITYADGTVQREACMAELNISHSGVRWYRDAGEAPVISTAATPGSARDRVAVKLRTVAGAAIPVELDGKVYYKTRFLLAHPDKPVAGVEFVLPEGATWTVDVKSIRY